MSALEQDVAFTPRSTYARSEQASDVAPLVIVRTFASL